jgi:hypothetical protein
MVSQSSALHCHLLKCTPVNLSDLSASVNLAIFNSRNYLKLGFWIVRELDTISMINSRILNMTIVATTTCNSIILDVLNNMINGNK